ncbi:MAG: hypothetical protein J5I93_16795 [Pirellulaceae bacterium]|nr:hypothetical protein [Pirellulaceae bacterium]
MLARLSRWTLPGLILLAGLTICRLAFVVETPRPLELPRSEPWNIEPRFDEPRMVTDQQLAEILDRVQPRLLTAPTEQGPVNTNNWIHALRLWSGQARFPDPAIPSGQQMLDYFLRDDVFQQFAGPQTPPLFLPTERGIVARSYDDLAQYARSGSFHPDDLLATLGESGVALDTPLVTRGGQGVVGDLLRQSLEDFHLERHEFEWTIISYARYAFPLTSWRNKYGQVIEVDALVDQLLGPPLELGPCNGLHRMEAVVVLYRADELAGGVLRPATRQKLLDHMQRVSGLLVQAQTPAGFWTRRWPEGQAAQQDRDHNLGDRLLVTGHHLEWLALAPDEVQPPRETLVRAGQWLARTLLEVDSAELNERYGPFSHGARALSFWRGKQPLEAWQAAHPAP